MSRATVRTALVAFIQPPAVAGLNRVFTAQPRSPKWADYQTGQPAGTQSGAIAWPFISRDSEVRIAMGGATSGKKRVDYTVELHILVRSTEKLAEATMDFYDTVIEAIKAKLRSNRQLNTTTIIQSGEASIGIEADHDEPVVLESQRGLPSTIIHGRVRFQATEVITS